jgi:Na+-translocating ferredoxin:NAD+ oxidoreductase RnfG subunit
MWGKPALEPIQQLHTLWPGVTFTARQTALKQDAVERIKAHCGRAPRTTNVTWYRAQNGDRAIFDSVVGKHLPIDYVLLLDAQGKVKALEILAYREAYGGQVKQRRWREQFLGRDTGSRLELGEDIDGIAGATMSCRHVTRGVQMLLAVSKELHEE